MSKSLTSRLDRLEAQHGGGKTILVTYDDETYRIPGSDRTLTRTEVDALPSVTIIRVVYEDQAARP